MVHKIRLMATTYAALRKWAADAGLSAEQSMLDRYITPIAGVTATGRLTFKLKNFRVAKEVVYTIDACTSNVTGRHRGPKSKRTFVCRYVALPVSVITTLYYVAIIFYCRVWYRALSVRDACIRSSGIILIPQATFVPNFVSFATSVAELAHGEKSRTRSLTHSLFDMLRTEALKLRNKVTVTPLCLMLSNVDSML